MRHAPHKRELPTSSSRISRVERAAVACSLLKGIHRWVAPFCDGDQCACGALSLYAARGAGAAACFEVHDA